VQQFDQDSGQVVLSIDLLRVHDLVGYVVAGQTDRAMGGKPFRAPSSWILKCSLDNRLFWKVDQRTMGKHNARLKWSVDTNVVLPIGAGTSLRNVYETVAAPHLVGPESSILVSKLPEMTNTALSQLALSLLKPDSLDAEMHGIKLVPET
jgi:hypothetical protein